MTVFCVAKLSSSSLLLHSGSKMEFVQHMEVFVEIQEIAQICDELGELVCY